MQFPLLVLAGGFGTRLQSVVSDRPKPLAPVCGKPFLEYLIASWVKAGQREFIFLLHHQAGQIMTFLQSLESNLLSGCTYSTIIENQPLGTGGAVANAVQRFELDKIFLVANADTWHGESIKDVRSATEPAIAVIEVIDVARYGAVRFDKNSMVTGFDEKEGASGPGWINAGIYHLHPNLFLDWDGRAFSLEQALFPRLVETHQLQAVLLQTEFIDIGIPKDYLRFNNWIENKRVLPL